jgi:hypothetical protein
MKQREFSKNGCWNGYCEELDSKKLADDCDTTKFKALSHKSSSALCKESINSDDYNNAGANGQQLTYLNQNFEKDNDIKLAFNMKV